MAIDPEAWTSDYTDEQMIEAALEKVPKEQRAALRGPLKARFKRGEAEEGWRAWGGPNAGQVVAALTRALPSFRDPAAVAQAEENRPLQQMESLSTGLQQQANPYAADNPAFQSYLANQMSAYTRGFGQQQDRLGQTLAGRGMLGSGMEAAMRANLGGQQATGLADLQGRALQEQYGRQQEWDQWRQGQLAQYAQMQQQARQGVAAGRRAEAQAGREAAQWEDQKKWGGVRDVVATAAQLGGAYLGSTTPPGMAFRAVGAATSAALGGGGRGRMSRQPGAWDGDPNMVTSYRQGGRSPF